MVSLVSRGLQGLTSWSVVSLVSGGLLALTRVSLVSEVSWPLPLETRPISETADQKRGQALAALLTSLTTDQLVRPWRPS